MAVRGVEIKHSQPFDVCVPWRVARTVISQAGEGFEVSTVVLPSIADIGQSRFETLVFNHPREVSEAVAIPELAKFNQSNIPDLKSAMRNHREAVRTASVVVKSRS